MDTIKDRNVMDLTEAENIKKRRQEYTELYKKRQKGRYTYMNTEFHRRERREKKAFLRNNADIEENNRMGKTRDLFKKIRDTKGTFHAKMGSIKERNGVDQQKQKLLRRGGKNTQKNNTKKILMTQIITTV